MDDLRRWRVRLIALLAMLRWGSFGCGGGGGGSRRGRGRRGRGRVLGALF